MQDGIVGVVAAFALVMGLLLVALRVLRRFAPGAGAHGTSAIPLSVLRRMPLGPRQGIAVVRVGDRVLAVSVGEGGVRLLTELEALPAVPPVPPPSSARTGLDATLTPPPEDGSRFRRALRNAIRSFAVALMALALQAGSVVAQAAPASVSAPQAASAARIDNQLPGLAPQLDLRVGSEGEGGLRLSGTVGIVVMMGLLTMLPMLVLLMTGFTRILIVMHFLRQAIGTQSAPPAQLVAGLSLLLTMLVMAPTIDQVNATALAPWMDGRMEQGEMLKTAAVPFREFMLAQTREHDLETFLELSGKGPVESEAEIPLVVLTSAFVTSELRVAFQIGFALFLPFIVIDIVVASVLMSVGMMMVPPAMISLPFKLLLFVLVDGWTLVIQGLVRSFN
ncbi:MAG: flagellar type III secretion system pore protein FliP [Gemmatimonadaceae bacterium]